VRETGADPAATDCARVLRLPGFVNHKYSRPYLVRNQSLSAETYGPERFPKVPEGELGQRSAAGITGVESRSERSDNQVSQSERDWAYAKRALARGDSETKVIAEIARYRPDKHDPQYYAEITVRKAADSVTADARGPRAPNDEPDR
jgi:hypothetical protein